MTTIQKRGASVRCAPPKSASVVFYYYYCIVFRYYYYVMFLLLLYVVLNTVWSHSHYYYPVYGVPLLLLCGVLTITIIMVFLVL